MKLKSQNGTEGAEADVSYGASKMRKIVCAIMFILFVDQAALIHMKTASDSSIKSRPPIKKLIYLNRQLSPSTLLKQNPDSYSVSILINNLRQAGIDEQFIHALLDIINTRPNIKETTERLSDSTADIASLITNFKTKGIKDDCISAILEALVLRNDVKQTIRRLNRMSPYAVAFISDIQRLFSMKYLIKTIILREDVEEIATVFKPLIRILRDVHLIEDYIDSILVSLVQQEEVKKIASSLETLVRALKRAGIDDDFIDKLIIPPNEARDGVREVVSEAVIDRLMNLSPEIAAFIDKLRLLHRGTKTWTVNWEIAVIFHSIIRLEDVKERIYILQSLIEFLQQTGINDIDINCILKIIAPQKHIKEIAVRLKSVGFKLPRARQRRIQIEMAITHARQEGKFSRSIVRFDGGGSGFVAGETKLYYILLTNSHIVTRRESIRVNAHAQLSEPIGIGTAVLWPENSEPETGDLALLVIEKEKVHGGELVPIKMVSEFDEGAIATLVSGDNDTISCGHIVRAGDALILLGAKSIPGDSGSPYLIKVNDEYLGIAVNRGAGLVGMLMSPNIIREMLAALNNEESIFKLATSDKAKLEAITKFLTSLHPSSLLIDKLSDSAL